MVKFKPTLTEEQIAAVLDEWSERWENDFPTRYRGLQAVTYGRDLGLRDGNMSITALFDFEDEASFVAFDTDDHHNRIRQEIAPLIERAERCQFRL
jgi:hypothetical protein